MVPLQERLTNPCGQFQIAIPLRDDIVMQTDSQSRVIRIKSKLDKALYHRLLNDHITHFSQEVCDHVDVIVGLGHLLHPLSAEDYRERGRQAKSHTNKILKEILQILATTLAVHG